MLKEFTNIQKAVAAATGLIVSAFIAVNYFATASAFAEHVRQQELKDLLIETSTWELKFDCWRESCRGKMPDLMYIAYVEKLARIDQLKVKK